MSRSQNLRHSVISQIIDDMARGHIPSSLPLQSVLAEIYNINRTTVCHILSHLGEYGVLTQVSNHYVIVRRPDHDDGFACTIASMTEQNRTPEQAFFTMTNQRQPRADESFSELQFAGAAGVSPVVVREYLLKFERYNLIKNRRRSQWSMKQFGQVYTEQLFKLREMLEVHSLQHFFNLPDDDPCWLQARTLLECHRVLCDSIGSSFCMFSQLDREFHVLLLSTADDTFFNQPFEIISAVFHFYYQWDGSDLKQRNIIAIGEYMTVLGVLVCHSDLDATLALRNRLNSIKQSMIRSINQGCNVAY